MRAAMVFSHRAVAAVAKGHHEPGLVEMRSRIYFKDLPWEITEFFWGKGLPPIPIATSTF